MFKLLKLIIGKHPLWRKSFDSISTSFLNLFCARGLLLTVARVGSRRVNGRFLVLHERPADRLLLLLPHLVT